MCGILGVVQGRGLRVSTAEIAAASEAIRHRGPDDSGVWTETDITFGHRRLSIVDLSPAGGQPMISACGRYVFTYNGEIYNHRALRAELDAKAPHQWRGESDTEVLLEMIARSGIEHALQEANGMFAFALWDRQETRLFLARDRFGEKPLYYALRDDSLAFASELAALEKFGGLNLQLSRDSIAAYFVSGYVPAPFSIYEGVNKLPPASLLSWRPGEQPRVHTYWSVDEVALHAVRNRRSVTMEQAVNELNELVVKATSARMVADVPVGVFLSGGVDSSLIAAAMQRCATGPVTTLSLGFQDPRFNEADHARAIAAYLGTSHIEETATAQQALDVVARLGRMFDEPLADSSQIPTYLVSEMARKHVTVALSGDGGDEVFAGYRRHFATPALWRRIRGIPARSLMGRAIEATPVSALDAGFGFLEGFSRRYGVGASVGQSMKRVGGWLGASSLIELHEFSLQKWPHKERLVVGAARPRRGSYAEPPLDDDVDQLCLHDIHNYLVGDILTKVDRASMAVSLETRIPFLDPAIVEFAFGLPVGLRMGEATGKLVLREVLKTYIPERLFDRAKAGFAPPLEAWLLGPLREWAEDLLSPSQLASHGVLEVAPVRKFWERYTRGGTTEDSRAWALLQFQSWISARG